MFLNGSFVCLTFLLEAESSALIKSSTALIKSLKFELKAADKAKQEVESCLLEVTQEVVDTNNWALSAETEWKEQLETLQKLLIEVKAATDEDEETSRTEFEEEAKRDKQAEVESFRQLLEKKTALIGVLNKEISSLQDQGEKISCVCLLFNYLSLQFISSALTSEREVAERMTTLKEDLAKAAKEESLAMAESLHESNNASAFLHKELEETNERGAQLFFSLMNLPLFLRNFGDTGVLPVGCQSQYYRRRSLQTQKRFDPLKTKSLFSSKRTKLLFELPPKMRLQQWRLQLGSATSNFRKQRARSQR
jgi:hypothetical protein